MKSQSQPKAKRSASLPVRLRENHPPITAKASKSQHGFALIATISVLILLALISVSLLSLSSVTVRAASTGSHQAEARANARMALILAIADLQKAAGPDQRVTATADLFTNNSSHTDKAPQQGRSRWVGVWDTTNYSPATPTNKTFTKWLVSSTQAGGLTNDTDAKSHAISESEELFKATDASGAASPADSVSVEKVPLSDSAGTQTGSYAYWVEDEGVKADLAWNENSFSGNAERQQAARLSSAPGVDLGVFGSDANSPLNGKVSYPLAKYGDNDANDWLADDDEDGLSTIDKLSSPADLPLLVNKSGDYSDWLKSIRHDVTHGSRAVLCDVKNGGLRRDLSLAFEMDGSAESENATLFNQQTSEFVGNGDQQSSPHDMPGTSLRARHLFRDTPNASSPFSSDITQSATVVRGPSWWLLRDYANLYKRLTSSGSNLSLQARAYFPNRSVATEDLVDMHADHQNGGYGQIKTAPTNRETNSSGNFYLHRPLRANYAPVLLGVNAIYSLKYEGRMKMIVHPFFILWNPYNTQITAQKFAITLEYGLAGGMRFRHTNSAGEKKYYGKPSKWGGGRGSDTSFADFAKRKSGVNADVSYLISDLSMDPGEVVIYSPPGESDRSGDANELNNELLLGMNYHQPDSGIVFDEFPEYAWQLQPKKNANEEDSYGWVSLGWKPIIGGGTDTFDALFNIASQEAYAIQNIIETSLPPDDRVPDELTLETQFGEQLTGQEFRLNFGGGITDNVDTGVRWSGKQKVNVATIEDEKWPLSYQFSELGGEKESFGLLAMLTAPTDYAEARIAMEAFSQLNATPTVRTQLEYFGKAPLNIVVKSISARGFNNLTQKLGFDLDPVGSGDNGFYGKSYSSNEGETSFPLLDIPKGPLHSLVQLSGANIGMRLFEPTHAIGNSWKPSYIPTSSVYENSTVFHHSGREDTLNDVSWQVNDALFDRYYLSGIASDFNHTGGYSVTGSISDTLDSFFSAEDSSLLANPALESYIPEGKETADIVTDLNPTNAATSEAYKKLGAYSYIKGAFNVNSTSVKAWSAFLRSNKDLAVDSLGGSTDSAKGTPFPLNSTPSDTNSSNGWEKFSRLTDGQIDALAAAIVDEVKTRGPFMSLSDFVNRRISNDSSAYQGALQEAIEQADLNKDIRSITSETIPNYGQYNVFPHASTASIGKRNNATGIPLEINQANILLPIAPKITARSDTFRIRGYGEATSSSGEVATAICEAVVQRTPEYVNSVDDPWDENYSNPLFPSGSPQLDPINQNFGRRFKLVSFRWVEDA